MKKFTLLFLMVAFCYFAQAQIILEDTDYSYDVTGGMTFTFTEVDTNSFVMPQAGADMVWDYSNIQYLNDYERVYESYSGTDFPSSNMRRTATTSYLGLEFPTYEYHTFDTTGFRKNGAMELSLALPLVAATGNVADTLFVVGGPSIETTPWYFFRFPLYYNKPTFATSSVASINYIANVPSFNLNNFPIVQTVERDVTIDVTGWGKLIIKNPNTAAIDTFEVLLQRATSVRRTYYYDANNNLLPPNLLTPLGLAQGASNSAVYYSFHTKALDQFAVSMSVFNGVLSTIDINRKLFTDAPTVNSSFIKENVVPHSVYPNPIPNNQFQLDIDKNNSENWQLNIYNSIGQLVQNKLIMDNISTIELNNNLSSGQYFYTISNEKGQVMANGKLIK